MISTGAAVGIALAVILLSLLLSLIFFILYLKNKYLGYLPISTESVAFDRETYADGEYRFDGNRDIEYLLTLCEKLRLFVLAAPGPYICAETQGGGIPLWLLQKRDIRIRHASSTFFRSYDARYTDYCRQWYSHILPILARHQITENTNGCVLALQIENEMFENLKFFPIGCHDDMRYLCRAARDLGMTVPFFTNDAFEMGSFNPKPSSTSPSSSSSSSSSTRKPFGIDLYGFDKYVIFVPVSTVTANILGTSSQSIGTWPEWSPSTFSSAVDKMEQTVRSFGGGASQSPIFIAELQGGWFNHYTVKHTYDHIYDFYGEGYTRMVLDSVAAQGVTMLSYYMFYGGTNWGTIGDPDVYTSYDYSTCIREYGFLSGRARHLRLGLSFLRSFSPYISQTDLIKSNASSSLSIRVVGMEKVLNRRRRCIKPASNGNGAVEFAFLRNFSKERKSEITIEVARGGRKLNIAGSKDSFTMKCTLPYKTSFIALGNYTPPTTTLRLIFASCPIHLRTYISKCNAEVWFIQNDDRINGEIAFEGAVSVDGTMDASVRTVE
ncbi:hypothetical protein HK102_008764, partial [Quaeritorhiza haematococci]